jgi:1,4-dihydroxy-2-naphthoyl-CoA hydrolase
MSIWFKKDLSIADLNPLGKGNMAEYLDIAFVEVGDNFIKASMPVDHRTRQPYGLLHGGASVTLAETLGSVAAAMVVDHQVYNCVGLEINANHIRGAREGKVTGITTPLHIGGSTQVWEIKITDDQDRLICVSRLTVAVIMKKQKHL